MKLNVCLFLATVASASAKCCITQTGDCPSGFLRNDVISRVIDLGGARICNKGNNCNLSGEISFTQYGTKIEGVDDCFPMAAVSSDTETVPEPEPEETIEEPEEEEEEDEPVEDEEEEEEEVVDESKEEMGEEESGCCLSQSGACPSGYITNEALSQVVDLGKAVICNKSSNCKIGAITVGRSATTVDGVMACPTALRGPTEEEIDDETTEDEEVAEDAEDETEDEEVMDEDEDEEEDMDESEGTADKSVDTSENSVDNIDDNSSAQRHLVGFGVALASFVATLAM